MAITLKKPTDEITQYDSVLMSFLAESVVRAELESKGARYTKISFMKKDGKIRTYVGRAKTYSRRIDPATATRQQIAASERATQSLINNGNIWLDFPKIKIGDDGKKRNGFSFNAGRVIGIDEVGTHPEQAEA